MNRTSLYIGALLLALAGFVYLSDSPERILGTSSAVKGEVNAVPYAVVRDTQTTLYKENGEINYTFVANRMEHYREKNDFREEFTLIEKPKLVLYEKSEPWNIEANKGRLNSQNEDIELWEDVRVEHTNEEGVKTIIKTQYVIIDPVSKLAKTEEPVTISSETDHIEIEGIGMNADLANKQLKLLSNVRGTYDPN